MALEKLTLGPTWKLPLVRVSGPVPRAVALPTSNVPSGAPAVEAFRIVPPV